MFIGVVAVDCCQGASSWIVSPGQFSRSIFCFKAWKNGVLGGMWIKEQEKEEGRKDLMKRTLLFLIHKNMPNRFGGLVCCFSLIDFILCLFLN